MDTNKVTELRQQFAKDLCDLCESKYGQLWHEPEKAFVLVGTMLEVSIRNWRVVAIRSPGLDPLRFVHLFTELWNMVFDKEEDKVDVEDKEDGPGEATQCACPLCLPSTNRSVH